MLIIQSFAGIRAAPRFVLDKTANQKEEKGVIRMKLTLTYEEIAQMIGTSREIVTRVFSIFRKKNQVVIEGSTLALRDKVGLERLVQN